ncbi:MAG: cytochrome c biogenesis protein CcsA [Bacteroidota bacterium]
MKTYWKIIGLALVAYSFVAGMLVEVPDLPVVRQSIRMVFYHVPMWFAMIAMLATSFFYSIRVLENKKTYQDMHALSAAKTAILFGLIGLISGMLWAQYAWGRWWINDPKLNGAALSLFMLFAYLILRNSVSDITRKTKVAAVYNIFAFVMSILFLLVYPRMGGQSIHPASGTESMMGSIVSLDNTMRLVFYPAVLGWIIIAFWVRRAFLKKSL